jgi:pectinesterase
MTDISRRHFIRAAGVATALPALSSVSVKAQRAAPDIGDLRAERDIVFGRGGDTDLTLDVYHPPEGVEPKRMAIIHLFGGGFFVGSKTAGYIINDAKALGSRGYTNISANYRLQSEGLWPAQIHDTKAAIRWTRANAERLGVDAGRIAVAGYSAGGMPALMAVATNGMEEFEGAGGNAAVSSDVQACIGVYPLASAQTARRLFADDLSESALAEAMNAASPTSYIGENFAPTIFIHGTADNTVPMSSSISFFEQLDELGVPTALTLIQGADHAFDNSATDAIEVMAQSVDLFLDRLLVDPRPYPGFGAGGRRRAPA